MEKVIGKQKLTVKLFQVSKKKDIKEFYDKFKSSGLVNVELTDKEISSFKTIKDIFYFIAKNNNKVKYSVWSKFVKVYSDEILEIFDENPTFINRIDSKEQLSKLFSEMSVEQLKKVTTSVGIIREIKVLAKSFYDKSYILNEANQESDVICKETK